MTTSKAPKAPKAPKTAVVAKPAAVVKADGENSTPPPETTVPASPVETAASDAAVPEIAEAADAAVSEPATVPQVPEVTAPAAAEAVAVNDVNPPKPAKRVHPMPTIGRTVLYRGKDGRIRPAIVTHVWGEFCINLEVFRKDTQDTEGGVYTSVTHADPEQEPGCMPSWHWMDYQKAVHAGEIAAARHALAEPVAAGPSLADVHAALVELGRRSGHPVSL